MAIRTMEEAFTGATSPHVGGLQGRIPISTTGTSYPDLKWRLMPGAAFGLDGAGQLAFDYVPSAMVSAGHAYLEGVHNINGIVDWVEGDFVITAQVNEQCGVCIGMNDMRFAMAHQSHLSVTGWSGGVATYGWWATFVDNPYGNYAPGGNNMTTGLPALAVGDTVSIRVTTELTQSGTRVKYRHFLRVNGGTWIEHNFNALTTYDQVIHGTADVRRMAGPGIMQPGTNSSNQFRCTRFACQWDDTTPPVMISPMAFASISDSNGSAHASETGTGAVSYTVIAEAASQVFGTLGRDSFRNYNRSISGQSANGIATDFGTLTAGTAVNASGSRNYLDIMIRDMTANGLSLFVIMLGGNDSTITSITTVSPTSDMAVVKARYKNNMQRILDRIRAVHPLSRGLLVGPPAVDLSRAGGSSYDTRSNDARFSFNDANDELAAVAGSNLVTVRLYEAFAASPASMGTDGIHYAGTAAGRAIALPILQSGLLALFSIPSLRFASLRLRQMRRGD